ncbi:DHA2 family efflux MFS transporter permease subunit [Streptomyces sp. NPDC048506]|uniref:DHA2 family efflux MFS transporter permease subunit n=1 Tax=Streptomyces sp. NPDC048506 TaxID=3155028 RepID=UPI00342EE275
MNPLRVTKPWLALSALCVGLFMILLDTTIVNVAVPSMQADLHAGLDQILWVVSIYILAYAVPLILASRLGDRFGRKRLYAIGLLVFTVASGLCGLSSNSTELIVARAVQGIGAALMNPQTLTFITILFPPNKRGAAFGVWSAVAGVSTITGPLLGGLIVEQLSWQWIFFVNVPIGVLGLVLTLFVVPESRNPVTHRLDPLGILLVSGGLFAIVYGLLEGSRYHWGVITGPVSVPALLVAGVLLVALFLLLQHRSHDPLVPLTLFGNRNFSLANIVATAVGFGMVSLLPLMLFLQAVLGLTPLQAGVVTAPASLCAVVIAPFAGFRADRTGGKYLLFSGLLAFCVGIGSSLLIAKPGMSAWLILPAVIVLGAGTGLLFTTMTTVAIGDIKPELSGAASGVFNTTRQLGQALGTAAVGALLQSSLRHSLHHEAVTASAQLPAPLRSGFVDNFANVSTDGVIDTGPPQPGVSASVAAQLHRLGKTVFDSGYVTAMRWTLLLPLGLLLVAAVCSLGIRRRPQESIHAGASNPTTLAETGHWRG